jgi:hypothetical protein
VRPVVPEIEHVDELLAGPQPGERRPAIVERRPCLLPVHVRRRQPRAVAEREVVEVRPVPAGEGVVDRLRQLGEGVATGGGEDAPGTRPEALAATFDELDSDRQPGARHWLPALVSFGPVRVIVSQVRRANRDATSFRPADAIASVAVAEPRLQKALRAEVEAISAEAYCAERLDSEYAELCRRLVAKLARKRPSPLVRVRPTHLGGSRSPRRGQRQLPLRPLAAAACDGDELSALSGVPKSTMANKSKRIRDLLRLGPFDREFCWRDLLEQSPLPWLVVVNGIVVDARWLPPELQAEACRRGLIPDLEPTANAA